jgi:Fe(3+) dicitrate transport protein
VGVETFIEVDLIKAFKGNSDWYLGVFSSYAYVNTEYLTSRFEGNRVEFAPEHIWKTGASLRGKNLSFTFNYSYISNQFSDANNTEYTETGNQGIIPSYTVLDFSGKYMIPNYGLALSVGVNNMLNNVYFTRRATSYPGPGIIPGEPTLWYVSVEYKFQK